LKLDLDKGGATELTATNEVTGKNASGKNAITGAAVTAAGVCSAVKGAFVQLALC
jgi:hypothetical protein